MTLSVGTLYDFWVASVGREDQLLQIHPFYGDGRVSLTVHLKPVSG
jgi:hypothetical protein